MDYKWIMLELLDQAVRTQNGGEMKIYLSKKNIPNEEFVIGRIGEEGREIISALKNEQSTFAGTADERFIGRLRKLLKVRARFNAAYEGLLKVLLGKDVMEALKIGRFRFSGEVHQWMYDSYSLSQLMLVAGFESPIRQSASKSMIPQWDSYNLDTLPCSTVIKPDSLYMETIKP